MFEINIYGEPLSKERIEQLREDVRSELTPAEKTLMYCPIPVVDAIAGLAVMALTDDPRERYEDDRGSLDRDWSQSSVAAAYAAKALAAGRLLIKAETEALERQVGLEAIGGALARGAWSATRDGAQGAMAEAARGAASALPAWLQSELKGERSGKK